MPKNYHIGMAVPLVVMLHGCTQTSEDFATGTQMNQLAERYGFIVIYPQQQRSANRQLCWNWANKANQARGHGEPAQIVAMVQSLVQDTLQWTIDTNRIYVVGLSAGGAMASILGATYPDIFAAVGIHSGVEYQAATGLASAFKAMRKGGPNPLLQGARAYEVMGRFARRVPTIVFHGTHDSTVTPVNGDQVVQQWMHAAQLASNGTYKADFHQPGGITGGQVAGGHSYTVYTWSDIHGEEVQSYWKVQGLGHAWSGGSPAGSYTDPRGPDASLAFYQFFMRHPLKKLAAAQAHEGSFWRNLRQSLGQLVKPKSAKTGGSASRLS